MRLMYRVQLVALLALPLLATACGLDDKSGFGVAGLANKVLPLVSENHNSEIPGAINDTVVLGTAYHSGEENFRNVRPVTGFFEETQGNATAEYVLEEDVSYLDMISRINGILGDDTAIKALKAGSSASVAIDQSATEYSNNFNFSAVITLNKSELLPEQNTGTYLLTSTGQMYADNYQGWIFEVVGDEFVTAIEYGAWVNVNLKVEYQNKQAKELIGGKLHVDVNGVLTLDDSIQYLAEEIKQSVKIKVVAIQTGGDPLELLKVIPDNLGSCTLENPQLCGDIFADLVQYAKNDFPGQLTSLDRGNVIRYTTQRYEDSGLEILTPGAYPTISLLVKMVREELDEKFQKAVLDRQRATNLLAMYSGLMTNAQRGKIEDIKGKASQNSSLYSYLGDNCFDNPYNNQCVDSYDQVKAGGFIKEYDDKELDLTIYFARCENAMQAAINAGWITLEFAETFRGYGWAPIYVDNANPAGDIVDWVACSEAISTYGDYFRNN